MLIPMAETYYFVDNDGMIRIGVKFVLKDDKTI